jgi:hypothetical protein
LTVTNSVLLRNAAVGAGSPFFVQSGFSLDAASVVASNTAIHGELSSAVAFPDCCSCQASIALPLCLRLRYS